MSTKACKLSLLGFRGATQPVEITFDTSKPIALVFGENGSGKSTIADAMDFVCNRRFGSLEDRSMASRPKSHVTSLGQDPKKLKVFLTTSSGAFTGTLAKDGPVVAPTTGCLEARILRRSNILQLLDAEPKKRFEHLKTFIAVPGIDKSENALREAVREVDSNYNESVRAYTQAITALDDLWAAEAKPGKSALDWATAEGGKDLSALEAAVNSITEISASIQITEITINSLDHALADLALARAALVTAQEEQKKLEAKQSRGNAALLDLLQSAKTYIAVRQDSSQCPVCENSVKTADLLIRLDTRIADMGELSKTATVLANANRSVASKESIFSQARKDFGQRIKTLGVLLKGCQLREVTDLNVRWPDFEDLLAHTDISDATEAKARELWATAQPCRPQLANRKQLDQKSINQRNAIKGHHDTHTEKLKTAKAFAALSEKLTKALEIVSKKRKDYVEGILASIAGEVERLYVKLHPGEGIGKIRFYLKPNTIGSLEFDAQFLSAPEVPPQAYYSDSHLDTLGICVFLALAKYFMTDNTIVVLDDVLTSVDGPHLDRFMQLLHDEAPTLNQVIVTTHYRPWKDRYRYARGQVAKVQVIELRAWSLNSGVQTDDAPTALVELKAALAHVKFDRQGIASKAGIQLENVLDFLTYQFRSRMPRQTDPNYPLGDLASGIDSALAKVLKVIKRRCAGSGCLDTGLHDQAACLRA
jgi:hypothetical protein